MLEGRCDYDDVVGDGVCGGDGSGGVVAIMMM